MINCIDASPFDPGTVYVAATSYKFGDYTPYLYKTDDYGQSWKLITDGIEDTYYTRAIRSDKVRKGLLYAGTEWGMYVSFDDGENWKPFQLNLPITAIRDLHVRDNDLIAATHGRGFWMIDDLTPLHQLSEEVANSDFYLYKPDMAYRMHQDRAWRKPDTKLVGENHPDGAIINYYLKSLKETDTVTMEILEMDGSVIQKFSNHAKPDRLNPSSTQKLEVSEGGNRFIWNMRYPGYKEFEGMVFYSSPNIGPKAVPGNYKARLTMNGNSSEQTFSIVKDPRVDLSQQDFQDQFDFLMKVREQVSRANNAIINIRSIKKDLAYLKEKTKDNLEIQKMAKDFETELSIIENNIHMTKNQSRQDPLNYGIRINNRLAFLMVDSQRGDQKPTKQAQEFFVEVTKELDKEINDLNTLVEKQATLINQKVEQNQIKMISTE